MITTKLYAIGGGLKLSPDNEIIQSFINDCGGNEPTILLVPSYLEDEDNIQLTWNSHFSLFTSLGVKKIVFCRPQEGHFDSAKYENEVENCTGVFFAGGSQRQLTSMLLNTKFLELIKTKWEKGNFPVAGTSAGCASLSETIILGGFEEPKIGKGFSFNNKVIFDQHFSSGNANSRHPRFRRLLMACHQYPNLLGVGVDENTCAQIYNNNLTVLGEASITIIDAHKSKNKIIGDIEDIEQIRQDKTIVNILKNGEKIEI